MKKNKILSVLFLLMILLVTMLSCSKEDSGSTYGGGTPPPGGGSPTSAVSISDIAFSSTTLTVAKGTTITWTNYGAVTHTVTSDDGTSFDSGNIAPGATYTRTFSTAGTFAYHCEIHPSMTASITINP